MEVLLWVSRSLRVALSAEQNLEAIISCRTLIINNYFSAIKSLLAKGVKEEKIVFVNVIACPEGIERLTTDFPKVKIVTGMIDPSLNENKYIVPGLGDYGDRFFATQ